jgi:hypothetical protein
VNKRNREQMVAIPGSENMKVLAVDSISENGPARTIAVENGVVRLAPFSVIVVSW